MKMRKQRLMGVGMLVISAFIFALASTGETAEDQDGTALLITFPLGVYMLVSKTYILYDGEAENNSKNYDTGKAVSYTHLHRGGM